MTYKMYKVDNFLKSLGCFSIVFTLALTFSFWSIYCVFKLLIKDFEIQNEKKKK